LTKELAEHERFFKSLGGMGRNPGRLSAIAPMADE